MARYCVNGHEVDDQMNFCPQCGAEIIEKKEQNRFCKKCGHERVGTEKYCSQCGTPYEESLSSVISDKVSTKWIKKIPRSLLIGLLSVVLIGGGLYYWICIRTDYSLEGLAKTLVENEFSEVGAFSDGLAMVCNDDYKIGYIDNKGNLVAPCIYNRFEDGAYFKISEGLICVQKDDKYGFIDKTGEEVFPCRYDLARSFSEGLAPVKKNGKWGYLDKDGKMAVPYKYDDAQSFAEEFAQVEKEGKWGFIDKTGKEVISCQYDWAESFSEGLAAVEKNEKWGFIDKTGKEVIPCMYDNWGINFSEGLAGVMEDEKWGFIDKTGKRVIQCKYENAGSFVEGLAPVQKNEKWGFIDKTGKEVIPCKYNWCDNFSEGLAAFSDNEMSYGFIDKTGKEVIPCQYDLESYFMNYSQEEQHGFSNGYARVVKEDLCGVINKKGEDVIPLGKYEEATVFSEGLAWVKKDGVWGIIDTKGKSTFDYLSESQKNVIKEKQQKAEEERIAGEEEERRRREEENKPSNVFYRLALNGNIVWSYDFKTETGYRTDGHSNTFFFYPDSPQSGHLSYFEFGWIISTKIWVDGQWVTQYKKDNDKDYAYAYCTAYYTITEDNILRATLVPPPTTITLYLKPNQSIVLKIVKKGDEIVLKEVDGIRNYEYIQGPVIRKDHSRM